MEKNWGGAREGVEERWQNVAGKKFNALDYTVLNVYIFTNESIPLFCNEKKIENSTVTNV